VKAEPKWWTYKVRFTDSKKIDLDLEEEYLSKRNKLPKDYVDKYESSINDSDEEVK